jgi:nitrite reductase/ring-hydroxylating ferredoxin subunit
MGYGVAVGAKRDEVRLGIHLSLVLGARLDVVDLDIAVRVVLAVALVEVKLSHLADRSVDLYRPLAVLRASLVLDVLDSHHPCYTVMCSGKGVGQLDTLSDNFVRAARLEDVRTAGRTSVRVAGHSLALFFHDGRVHAVDNRCPHMGFPLHRGTLQDGILTCHWHHARFDLESGGTFDQFADEARVFPVEVRDGEVWIALSTRGTDRPTCANA